MPSTFFTSVLDKKFDRENFSSRINEELGKIMLEAPLLQHAFADRYPSLEWMLPEMPIAMLGPLWIRHRAQTSNPFSIGLVGGKSLSSAQLGIDLPYAINTEVSTFGDALVQGLCKGGNIRRLLEYLSRWEQGDRAFSLDYQLDADVAARLESKAMSTVVSWCAQVQNVDKRVIEYFSYADMDVIDMTMYAAVYSDMHFFQRLQDSNDRIAMECLVSGSEFPTRKRQQGFNSAAIEWMHRIALECRASALPRVEAIALPSGLEISV